MIDVFWPGAAFDLVVRTAFAVLGAIAFICDFADVLVHMRHSRQETQL